MVHIVIGVVCHLSELMVTFMPLKLVMMMTVKCLWLNYKFENTFIGLIICYVGFINRKIFVLI